MKKIIYILTFLFTFISCSNNDEVYEGENLNGKWKITKYEVKDGLRKSISNGTITSQSTFHSYAKNINGTYDFVISPNKLTTSRATFTEVITRVENGNSNQVEIPSIIEEESFSWELIGNLLKTKNSNKDLESKITFISENEIIITFEESFSLGNNTNKIEVSSKKITTLKKI